MNPNDELNSLGYASSAPDFAFNEEIDVKPEDLADLTILEQVNRLLVDRKKYFQSIESLNLEDANFSIDQQLAINKQVLFHIQELHGLVGGTVKKAKEKLKYGQR